MKKSSGSTLYVPLLLLLCSFGPPLAFLCGPIAFAQLSTRCGCLFRVVASGVWVVTWCHVVVSWWCCFAWRSRFDTSCVEEVVVIVFGGCGAVAEGGGGKQRPLPKTSVCAHLRQWWKVVVMALSLSLLASSLVSSAATAAAAVVRTPLCLCRKPVAASYCQ